MEISASGSIASLGNGRKDKGTEKNKKGKKRERKKQMKEKKGRMEEVMKGERKGYRIISFAL